MDGQDIPRNCTAHSGVSTKMNLNIVLSGFGVVTMAFLLATAADIRAGVLSIQGTFLVRMEQLERRIDYMDREIRDIKTQRRVYGNGGGESKLSGLESGEEVQEKRMAEWCLGDDESEGDYLPGIPPLCYSTVTGDDSFSPLRSTR